MGKTLLRMVHEQQDMKVVGGTERKGSSAIGSDVGEGAQLGKLGVLVADDLGRAMEGGEAQLVIDFTSAGASLEHARICADCGVPLVIGSTGFSSEAKAELARSAQRIPVVMSPNMSVGVNLVIKIAGQLAQVLGDSFDIEILQTHRGGDVVGDHTVFFLGEGERVELTHRATSREQFGRGALRAARWVVARPPGLYDMQDVL